MPFRRASFAFVVVLACTICFTVDAAANDEQVRSHELSTILDGLEMREGRRLNLEVVPAASPERVSLAWRIPGAASTTLRVWGDPNDRGLVRFELMEAGQRHDAEPPPLKRSFRLWPDVEKWSTDESERKAFAAAFSSLPGWKKHWLRVAVDLTALETRVWADGRMLWSIPRDFQFARPFREGERRTVPLAIALGEGASVREAEVTPLPDDRFLPIDLRAYFNNDGFTGGDLGDGFSLTSNSLPGEGMVSVGSVPFLLRSYPGQPNNLDLGATAYRSFWPYLYGDSLSSDPKRALFRVPKRYYDRAHFICVADNQEGEFAAAAVRMLKTGRGNDASVLFDVPRWGDEPAASPEGVVVEPLPTVGMKRDGETSEREGRLWRVSVPLNPAAFQEYLAADNEECLEIDLTRLIGFGGEYFPHPAGPGSAVHIFAMTLEEAPAEMVVTSEEIGHLFEAPNAPVMSARLRSQRDEERVFRLTTRTRGPDGAETSETRSPRLGPWEEKTESIELPGTRNGKYDVTFQLATADAGSSTRVLERTTSYAVIPQYDRQAKDDSPFGIWCFFEGHFGAGPEIAGPLMQMVGARWTLGNFLLNRSSEENAKRVAILEPYDVRPSFGWLCGIGASPFQGIGDVEAKIQELRAASWIDHYNVFWETALSPRTRDMIPPEVLGKPPLELTDEELENIRKCREMGEAYTSRARKEFPEAKLLFGNGFPFFIAAMLRDGYPKEWIDGFGLDFDLYTSMPERQPGILYAPFAGLHQVKALQEIYGYEGIPLYLTEAIYAPVAPVWLTEREQADHYVRTHLLGLAAGVKRFGMCTELWDPGGWFGYGHYGPVGLCHRPPELNPRESFCAYATMTAALDQARFERIVPAGSPSVYGLEFAKPDGRRTYAFWTVRGTRPVSLRLSGDERVRLTNQSGDARWVDRDGDVLDIEVTSSPVYVESRGSVTEVVLGDPKYAKAPEKIQPFVDFDTLEGWTRESGSYELFESVKANAPLVPASLELETARSEGGVTSLRVGIPERPDFHPLETAYTVLKRTGPPLDIPESATALGAWTVGNSSWGRVLFEVEDARGWRWLSARSDTSIDFDGRRYMETPLPHGARGRKIERSGFRPWVSDRREAVPEYPLTLVRLVFEARSHVVRGADLEPVPERQYRLEQIVLR